MKHLLTIILLLCISVSYGQRADKGPDNWIKDDSVIGRRIIHWACECYFTYPAKYKYCNDTLWINFKKDSFNTKKTKHK